jgi:hypothetical protein
MKRRKFTAKFKTKVVLEAIKESKTLGKLRNIISLHRPKLANGRKSFYRV